MNAQPNTKLVIVAKNTMLAESLSNWLRHQPGLTVLGRAEADADGLDFCRLNRPDMVLVDVSPPQFAGLDLVETLRQDLPAARVVV
ncbi:MAG: response regulator, partial [Verrucomicrobiota bacterium]